MSLICSYGFEYGFYCISGSERYSDVRFLKRFATVLVSGTLVCEGGPFCFLCGFLGAESQ